MSLEHDSTKVEILRLVNEGVSLRNIEETLGISRSAISRFLRKETYKDWWVNNEKPIASGSYLDHHSNVKKLNNKRYILTSAQNNTFIHPSFLASLEVMAKDIDAKIIVGTYSYNTNGFQNLQKGDGEWFDPKIVDYILDEPVELAKGLMWLGELNILPTAVNPLSGLQSYSMGNSAIVPHAKVQLESLPTHMSDPVRMMYTTGSVTKRNYIQKKAGQKASFHHVFGALVVEVDDDGDWFVRQIVADSRSGEFYDLDVKYTPQGKLTNQRVEAINWGDIHVEKLNVAVKKASFANDGKSILDWLNPKYQFIHDVYDAHYRSHHTVKDYHKRFDLFVKGKESVKEELSNVFNFLKSIEKKDCKTVIVNSNHDRALDRWLNEADYRLDHINAIFFLQLQLKKYTSIEDQKEICLLEEALRSFGEFYNIKFLKVDESFKLNEIEYGMHGDLGISGGKGSALSFSRLGSKVNVGHSHSAKIIDGVYQAGHSMDISKVDYVKGLTTWSNSHIITYSNGKRTIVTLKNGKWRA